MPDMLYKQEPEAPMPTKTVHISTRSKHSIADLLQYRSLRREAKKVENAFNPKIHVVLCDSTLVRPVFRGLSTSLVQLTSLSRHTTPYTGAMLLFSRSYANVWKYFLGQGWQAAGYQETL